MQTQPVMPSVEWLDAAKVDKSFTHDVPLIPAKTGQATFDFFIEDATDSLFEYEPAGTFAMFTPCPTNIRMLFQRRVLGSVDTDKALKVLDELDSDSSEKILAMLYTLSDLNDLSETIYLLILSTVKP